MKRKPITLLTLLVVLLGLALGSAGTARAQGGWALGLIPSPAGRYPARMPPGMVRGPLRAAVDLSAGLPPVGDQGGQQSSVAWATTYYYKTFQEAQERGWDVNTVDHQFSPAMTYNLRTRYTPADCTVDEGMRFPDAFDILSRDGALPLSEFPYSDADPCTHPLMGQLADAHPYRALGYGAFFVYGAPGYVTQDQIDALKAHLTGGDLLVLGIEIFDPGFTQPVDDIVDLPGPGDLPFGYHAVTLVGYDDAVGGFKFVNSWGPAYAGDGYAYLTYDYVRAHALEAWWMVDLSAATAGCISGTVRDAQGQPLADVAIDITGPAAWSGITDAAGTYSTGAVLPPGTYTVTASRTGYAFTPASAQVAVVAGPCAVQDFVASNATLWIDPPQQTINCDQETTVTVQIRDVVDMYGVQFELSFDPAVVEVIDPDGDPANGILVPGSIFPPNEYYVGYEVIDNAAGTISYAISLLREPRAGPFSGSGPVVEIRFRALSEGVSPLALSDAKVSDNHAEPINILTEDGAITVECPAGIRGFAYLESRADHSGIVVTVEGTGLSTTTDASGAYSLLGVPAGTHTVTFVHDKFLTVEAAGVTVVDDQVTDLCAYRLPAGDLNSDGGVDILDLALCAASFGQAVPDADVNADGTVDIYDLVLIGKNFKLYSPQPGVCLP